jgi:hypothetical protein
MRVWCYRTHSRTLFFRLREGFTCSGEIVCHERDAHSMLDVVLSKEVMVSVRLEEVLRVVLGVSSSVLQSLCIKIIILFPLFANRDRAEMDTLRRHLSVIAGTIATL